MLSPDMMASPMDLMKRSLLLSRTCLGQPSRGFSAERPPANHFAANHPRLRCAGHSDSDEATVSSTSLICYRIASTLCLSQAKRGDFAIPDGIDIGNLGACMGLKSGIMSRVSSIHPRLTEHRPDGPKKEGSQPVGPHSGTIWLLGVTQ